MSLVAFAAVGGACSSPEMPQEFVDVPPDSIGEGYLAGYWRWVSTQRDSTVTRPMTPQDALVFRLGPWGGYQERVGEEILTSRYYYAEGKSPGQDSSYTVLLMDSSLFFPRATEDYHGVAIRDSDGRILVLSGTGTDATLHTFSRVAPRQIPGVE